jgi:hypothetical protein
MLLNTLSPDTSNLNSLYFIKCRLKLGTCVILADRLEEWAQPQNAL